MDRLLGSIYIGPERKCTGNRVIEHALSLKFMWSESHIFPQTMHSTTDGRLSGVFGNTRFNRLFGNGHHRVETIFSVSMSFSDRGMSKGKVYLSYTVVFIVLDQASTNK